MGVLLLGSLLGAVLGLAWRWRRGWLWLAAAGVTVLLWGEGAPLPAVLAGAAGSALLLRWAFRAFSEGAGAGGVRVRNAERGTSGARTARLEAVAWGAEPPPRVWPVRRLVPQGPRPRWRLRWHLVPLERERRGYVTTVIGSGGTGKSYLLVDLAIALLTGTAWLGHPVLGLRSVLYVDAELDVDTMRERAWQVARGRGLSRPPGPSRWWQLPLARVRPRGLYYLALPVSLATEEGLELVARKAKACGAALVLFDSLTIGSAGAGLSDQNAWNTILSGMEAWGVPCVVIDHMGKTEGRGAVGSFMKQAKVRSALELERKADGTVVCEHAKSNFGPMLPEWRIRPVFEHCDGDDPAAGLVRFDVVGVPDGEPVVHRNGTPDPPARRWGTREQLVLDAFRVRGGAGATAKTIGLGLRQALGSRAERHVYDAVKKLEAGGALLAVEKVPTPGGGPPATRYVAAGALPVAGVAIAQAEALLRQALPREGGAADVTAEGAIGWLWDNAQTTAVVFLVLATAGLLVRVGYLVALALADLRLRWRGGDAAGQLADWLSGGRGGPGGHSLLYDTYLQSDAWRARRERTLLLAGGVCQDCGRARATDAHHKHYRTLTRERDGDLLALCPECHRRAHGR